VDVAHERLEVNEFEIGWIDGWVHRDRRDNVVSIIKIMFQICFIVSNLVFVFCVMSIRDGRVCTSKVWEETCDVFKLEDVARIPLFGVTVGSRVFVRGQVGVEAAFGHVVWIKRVLGRIERLLLV